MFLAAVVRRHIAFVYVLYFHVFDLCWLLSVSFLSALIFFWNPSLFTSQSISEILLIGSCYGMSVGSGWFHWACIWQSLVPIEPKICFLFQLSGCFYRTGLVLWWFGDCHFTTVSFRRAIHFLLDGVTRAGVFLRPLLISLMGAGCSFPLTYEASHFVFHCWWHQRCSAVRLKQVAGVEHIIKRPISTTTGTPKRKKENKRHQPTHTNRRR